MISVLPSCDANMSTFRVQKNAASLKLDVHGSWRRETGTFRVQKNAASLKHERRGRFDVVSAPLPRSEERGLIEARRYGYDQHRRNGDPSAFRRMRPH